MNNWLLLFVLFLGTATMAQDLDSGLSPEQEEKLQNAVEAYDEVLDMTDYQRTEFESILRKQTIEMIALRDEEGGKLSKYKKVMAIRDSHNAYIEKVLTVEQYELFLDKQKEISAEMRSRRKG